MAIELGVTQLKHCHPEYLMAGGQWHWEKPQVSVTPNEVRGLPMPGMARFLTALRSVRNDMGLVPRLFLRSEARGLPRIAL
jgi:hypothetical protein